jgi:hypothetical protein
MRSTWWVTTGNQTQSGYKIAGPFDTRDQAWDERNRIEKAEDRADLWFEQLPPEPNKA